MSGWPAPSSASRIARDLAVHHPRRRDDVGAGVGLRDRDLRVALEGGVVVDLAVGVEDPAVPVVGVLVEAVVGHEHELVADLVAQVAQRDLHDAVGVVGARAARVLRPRARRRGSRPGRRGRRGRRTSLRRLSWVCWTTPGIDATGSGASMPSFTNSGATRSSTERRVSATSRRMAGVRRSRRGRCSGNGTTPWLPGGLARPPTSRSGAPEAGPVAQETGRRARTALRGRASLAPDAVAVRRRRLGGARRFGGPFSGC